MYNRFLQDSVHYNSSIKGFQEVLYYFYNRHNLGELYYIFYVICIILSKSSVLSPRSGVNPRAVHLEFVADKAALGQFYIWVLRFSCLSIGSPVLLARIQSSVTDAI
jgi:hypothetical protein